VPALRRAVAIVSAAKSNILLGWAMVKYLDRAAGFIRTGTSCFFIRLEQIARRYNEPLRTFFLL
jgi:hypothetical protein